MGFGDVKMDSELGPYIDKSYGDNINFLFLPNSGLPNPDLTGYDPDYEGPDGDDDIWDDYDDPPDDPKPPEDPGPDPPAKQTLKPFSLFCVCDASLTNNVHIAGYGYQFTPSGDPLFKCYLSKGMEVVLSDYYSTYTVALPNALLGQCCILVDVSSGNISVTTWGGRAVSQKASKAIGFSHVSFDSDKIVSYGRY